MSTPRYIEHVTLTTGHTRRAWREEISEQALAACSAIIDRLGSGAVSESIPIPGVSGYWLTGKIATSAMVCNIIDREGHSIVTIGVATRSRAGATLWRELHRWGDTPVVTDPERPPPVPWVAAAVDAAVAEHPDVTGWAGDLERCLGWAFLECSQ